MSNLYSLFFLGYMPPESPCPAPLWAGSPAGGLPGRLRWISSAFGLGALGWLRGTLKDAALGYVPDQIFS